MSENFLDASLEKALAEQGEIVACSAGVSMYPMLRNRRDTIVIKPYEGRLKKYDVPLYRRANGKYILHRVVNADQTYTCIGDNQFYEEFDLRHDQMIAVVTAFYRNNKVIYTSNFFYQVYCRIWHYSRPVRHLFKRGICWLWRHLKT